MLKIGVFTDVQYADRDSEGKRDYRDSIPKFLEAIGSLEMAGVDFLLHLGDACNNDWSNLTVIGELFYKIRKPFYNVLGNHDFLVPDEKKSGVYDKLYVPKPGYYSFIKTDPETGIVWRFVVLNGNEISVYAAENDEEREVAEEWRKKYPLANGELSATWNGAMSARQLEWLDKELIYASVHSQRVIVCNHFPLYSQGDQLESGKNIPLSRHVPIYFSHIGVSLWNGDELLDVLDKHPDVVKGYFAGHLHEGGFGIRNGIPHKTFKGMVEWPKNAWSLVTIQGEEILFNDYPEE